MAKTITERFDTLLKKAKLSNKVSKQALIDANEAWQAYKKRLTALRDPHDLADILAKLDIILNQVAWKQTRIEPTQWHSFCELHTAIATSLRTGQPLEPMDKLPAKANKPANDSTIGKIGRALNQAITQAEKRTTNQLQAVA